jgi:hypothetical protein
MRIQALSAPTTAIRGQRSLCVHLQGGLAHLVVSTLDAVAAAGSAIWRTDEHGTVTMTFEGGVPAVATDR